MTATINLTEEELAEVKALTNEDDPTTALRRAMSEYIRYAKRLRLKELSNKVTMENNWEELEQQELNSTDDRSCVD